MRWMLNRVLNQGREGPLRRELRKRWDKRSVSAVNAYL